MIYACNAVWKASKIPFAVGSRQFSQHVLQNFLLILLPTLGQGSFPMFWPQDSEDSKPSKKRHSRVGHNCLKEQQQSIRSSSKAYLNSFSTFLRYDLPNPILSPSLTATDHWMVQFPQLPFFLHFRFHLEQQECLRVHVSSWTSQHLALPTQEYWNFWRPKLIED